jgi:hypothetical protein
MRSISDPPEDNPIRRNIDAADPTSTPPKSERSLPTIDADEHPTRNDQPMHDPTTARMVLELDPGEPISGRLQDQTGHVQPFRGWLELATKLERLRHSEAQAATNPHDDNP